MDWLPPEGESAVAVQSEGIRLRLQVDFVQESGIRCRRAIVFHGLCDARISASPGVTPSAIAYSGSCEGERLIEYVESEAASAWTAYFGSRGMSKDHRIRHFVVFFASENWRVEVFARDWTLNDIEVLQ